MYYNFNSKLLSTKYMVHILLMNSKFPNYYSDLTDIVQILVFFKITIYFRFLKDKFFSPKNSLLDQFL